MSELQVGAVIAGLRIDAVAGRGGMGVVYRATDLELGRLVAVKVIKPELASDTEFRARFKRESAMAASLDHPHVIPIYHAGETAGLLYLTMRFADGTDLRGMVSRHGRLDPGLATLLVSQIASALDAAHARGLVHRDVKPANVLIASLPSGPHAYLTDFGLTKLASSSDGLTQAGLVLGTLDYLAPEQLQGAPLDGRSDIYSLGCVLFYAITGRVPFPRENEAAKMWAHLNVPPPLTRQVDPALAMPELEVVLQRAMAKRPDERFGTAGEFGQAALAAVGAGSGAMPAWPAGPPRSGSRPVRRPDEETIGTAYRGRVSAGPAVPLVANAGQRPGAPSVPDVSPVPPRARRRRLLAALAGVSVLVLLAVAATFVLTGRGVGGGSTGAPSTTAAPPTNNQPAGMIVGDPIPVGPEPRDLAIGAGFVWTANFSSDTISKIDPATGTSQEIKVGGGPSELLVDGDAVWVWNYTDAVTRVDATTGEVSQPIRSGGPVISSIEVGGGYVWLSHSADGTISRINMATRRPEGAPVKVGSKPLAMAYGLRSLFVINSGDQTISVLSGTTGQVLGEPVALGQGLGGLEIINGVIYVGTTGDVTPVDEQSLVVGEPISILGGSWFTIGGGSMWVVLPLENALRRYDLTTREYRAPVPGVGSNVQAVEFADGIVWMANSRTNAVVRVAATP